MFTKQFVRVIYHLGIPNISPCLFTFAVIKNQRLGPVLEIEQELDLTTIPKLEALLLVGDDYGNIFVYILTIFSNVPYSIRTILLCNVRFYYINLKLYCRMISSLMFENF